MNSFRDGPRGQASSWRNQNQTPIHRWPDTHLPGANSRGTLSASQSTQREPRSSSRRAISSQSNLEPPRNRSHNNNRPYRRPSMLEETIDRLQREKGDLQREQSNLRRDHNHLQRDYDKLGRDYDNLERRHNRIKLKHGDLETTYGREHRAWQDWIREIIAPYRESKWPGSKDKPIETIMESLVEDAIKAGPLHKQVQISKDKMQVLQLEMLSRVEKVRSTPDEQFAQEFKTIRALVKSLSRSVQIVPDINVLAILNSPALAFDISENEWQTRAGRKRYVEALIWSVLCKQLFDHPFSILGNFGELINHVWSYVFGQEHCGLWPAPATPCEVWRYTTIESSFGALGQVSTDLNANETLQHHTMTPYVGQSIARVPVDVAKIIRSKLLLLAPTDDLATVDTIVGKAIRLAREMALQRSRLQITFPLPGETYNPDRMTNISYPDGDDVDEGLVVCTVNPGLTKWGDAHGDKFDQRYDIVPALVQLEPLVTVKSEYLD